MKKFLALAFCVLLLPSSSYAGWFGPDDFEVTQPDMRFSNGAEIIFVGHNNRVSSKSIAGGTYINSQGIYLDPVIVKDKATGRIISLQLQVSNLTDIDTAYGDPNSLGVLQSIAFAFADGPPVVLQAENSQNESSGTPVYNSITRSASSPVTEIAVASIGVPDFIRIFSAANIAIRISGSRRTVTYENDDISKDFRANLEKFYTGYIK